MSYILPCGQWYIKVDTPPDQVSRTVKSQGRDCCGSMSLSLLVSRFAVTLPPSPPAFLLPTLSSHFSPLLSPSSVTSTWIWGSRGSESHKLQPAMSASSTALSPWWLMPGCSLCFSFLALSLHWTPLTSYPQCLLSIQYKRRNQSGKCVSCMLHAWQTGCECLMELLKAFRCRVIMSMSFWSENFESIKWYNYNYVFCM